MEDKDEDAEARATFTSGASNVAYRTQRTTGFSFAFQRVHYTATFNITCPGNYDVVVHYNTKPHGGSGPVRYHALTIRKYFEAGIQTIEGNVDPKQKDVDYTVTGVEARTPCGDAPPGGGSFNIGSVRALLSLGRDAGGFSAGGLLLEANTLTASIYTPELLVPAVPDLASIEVVRDASGILRQVKAPQAFADVVVLNSSSYEVRFYALSQVGAKEPQTGIYAVIGAPFATYKFENPDAAQSLATRLRITETRGTAVEITEYAYDTATSAWTLSEADGLRRVSEVSAIVNGDIVKTTTIRNDANQVVSKTARTYHTFAWGEELTKEVLDPDGVALTTTYEFYSSVPTTDPNYKRLKQRTDANGAWERFTYDTSSRVLKSIRPFLSAGPSTTDETLCRVIENTYDTLADADGDTLPEARTTTIERTLGVETARRYRIDWSKPVTLSGDACKRRSDIVCLAASAAWNASANLVTETLTYAEGDFAGRNRRTLNPDGTASLMTYSLATSGILTTTAKAGQPNANADDIIAGTRTITLTSALGQITSETVTDIASALTLSSWTATLFDALGRPTRLDYADGTFISRTYACCGLESERDRTGVVTNYDYDPLGRQIRASRPDSVVKTTYDADGRVKSTIRVGSDNSEIVQTVNAYDPAGRLLETRDALNRVTTYAEIFNATTGQTTRTTTQPDGGTTVEVRARDGSLLSTSGTAAAPHAYDYGVESGSLFIKDTVIGADTNGQPTTTEWTKTYTDFAGRTSSIVFADNATATSHYNALGQLIRQIDPDGVTTLFAYNARGEQEVTALDLNGNNAIDYNGSDRITKTTSVIATKTDGGTHTVQRSTTQMWETADSDTPVTVSISEQSADGLRSWQTTRGLTTTGVTVLDGSGGSTVTTTTPDGVKNIQVFAAGRLVSHTVKTAADVQLAGATYVYDPHGRLQTMTDARNGATTYTYHADDQLHTVTTPDPDTTQSGPGYDPQTTTHTYDSAGRLGTVTAPDGGVVTTTYWPTGAVKRTSGARTYPVEYTYDPQGRVKTLTTWQNFAGDSGKAVTTWNYHATRGWLENKRYADNTGPTYTYKASGRLLTRTWARTPTLTTTYGYNAAGELVTTDYSDTTPDVTLTYDRAGRPKTIADGTGARTLTYHASGQLEDEAHTAGLLNGFAVDRSFDSLSRLSSLSALSASSVLNQLGYTYDAASRLDTVTTGQNTATYAYLANSPLAGTVTFKNNGATRLTTTKSYDKLNRLSSIASAPSAASAVNYAYTYNAANQRTRVTREDNAYWSYGYDPLGQVTTGKKFLATAAAIPGHDYAWTYDDIGNRKTSTVNGANATYAATLLNHYTQRTVPGAIDVTGAAATAATVTVAVNNGTPQPTTRQGELFYKQLTLDNTAAAQAPQLKITGVKNLVGPNGEDAVTEISKTAFVAQTPETFTHDADGNLTADARWTYTWDAENRLIALETAPAAVTAGMPRRKLEFAYDAQGRRVAKRVSNWTGTAWLPTSYHLFLYDGWNLLAELDALAGNTALRTYAWGLDLSGSAQGAGGVGGLLSVTDGATGTTHYAAYDGNGNVGALVHATTGTLTAKYDYNAFGETVQSEGPFAASNPFRFSTKFTDSESGHLYYGYRCYAPETGRWLSRDPIEEEGGVNIYVFVGNSKAGMIDPDGRFAWSLLRHGPTFTIPLPPPWPSISLGTQPYNFNGGQFDADLTVSFSWGFTGGPLARLSARLGVAIGAEVGFEGTGTVKVCGDKLVSGSSVITVTIFGSGFFGAGSRTFSGRKGYTQRLYTRRGVEVERHIPAVEDKPGLFGNIRIEGSVDVDISTNTWSNFKAGASVEGGWRFNSYFNYSFAHYWQLYP